MNTLISIVQVVVSILGLLALTLGIFLFLRFRWPAAAIWALKVVVSALSTIFLLVGLLTLGTGIITGSIFISIVGALVVLVYSIHFISVTRSPKGAFERVFGENWIAQIKTEQKRYFLSSRSVLKLPAVPQPRFEQNIPFATIPGSDRKLLCDIWQPATSVRRSGVAFIYIHGSAFYFLDKDVGTRPFFRHLAAQGHVIMDIAYRLAPETDLMGMIQDVKRAIHWMKANSGEYGVDPDGIILAGASSGGFQALMTAYTADDEIFAPDDLKQEDLTCCAVIGIYPATDLEALYYHTNQHLTTRPGPNKLKKKVRTEMPRWMKKRMGEDLHRLGMDKGFKDIGIMAPLMGGHPDECPERYRFFSPITHIHSDCPPTLIIHGQHDIMAPVKPALHLYRRLLDLKVPAIMHTLPQSDHAFDLFMPGIAPAAHNLIYDAERFLAIVANRIDEQRELRRKEIGTRIKNESLVF